MKGFLFLTSLAVLAVAAPASGDRPSAAVQGGAVVFTSTRDGDPDVYAVNPDGTGLTQLTNDPAEDYTPIPSPDGQHIFFCADDVPTVINADGTGRHALRDCSLEPGGWSPDSRHFVCSAYEEGLLNSTPWTGPSRLLPTAAASRSGLPTGETSRSWTRTDCSSFRPLGAPGDGSVSGGSASSPPPPGLRIHSGWRTWHRGTGSTSTRSGRSAPTAPAGAESPRGSGKTLPSGHRTDRGSPSSGGSHTRARRSTPFGATAPGFIA